MVFGFEELFYHEYFEGGSKFLLGEGFCQFSNIFSDVGEVLSEVEDGVNVNPKHFVGFVWGGGIGYVSNLGR